MSNLIESMEKKKSRKSKKAAKLESVVYVSWEESERGWGTRPDGFSLHLTESDYRSFVKVYWAGMPDSVPHEYSRPAGSPTKAHVSKNLYEEINKSNNGIRGYDETTLVDDGDLIFISQRSGWMPMNEDDI